MSERNIKTNRTKKQTHIIKTDALQLQTFKDNREETSAQLKLQNIVNLSPQVQKTTQLKNHSQPIQEKKNNIGLPNNLKSGIENLSGHAMDDVKVHYNSEKPAQINAHAYAQGTDIHIASGQEKHLPHEAWHVVQQKQGRVKPTTLLKGKVHINDDKGLEREADVMGEKANSSVVMNGIGYKKNKTSQAKVVQSMPYNYIYNEQSSSSSVIQRKPPKEGKKKGVFVDDDASHINLKFVGLTSGDNVQIFNATINNKAFIIWYQIKLKKYILIEGGSGSFESLDLLENHIMYPHESKTSEDQEVFHEKDTNLKMESEDVDSLEEKKAITVLDLSKFSPEELLIEVNNPNFFYMFREKLLQALLNGSHAQIYYLNTVAREQGEHFDDKKMKKFLKLEGINRKIIKELIGIMKKDFTEGIKQAIIVIHQLEGLYTGNKSCEQATNILRGLIGTKWKIRGKHSARHYWLRKGDYIADATWKQFLIEFAKTNKQRECLASMPLIFIGTIEELREYYKMCTSLREKKIESELKIWGSK